VTPLLFRVEALHFRKNSADAGLWDFMNNKENIFNKELLFALESARTKLAVAIAEETKSTPPHLWQYYMETSYQMGRCLKRLRNRNSGMDCRDWRRALEMLKQLPRRGEVSLLCEILREVVSDIEGN
jgi:hypothetical protein